MAVTALSAANWTAHPGGGPELLERLSSGVWHPIHSQADRTAYRVETEYGTFFAKHYRPVDWMGGLRDFWLRRKPQRAYRLASLLVEQGVSTPRPLGLFESRSGSRRQALLITEWIDRAVIWRQSVACAAAGESGRGRVRAALAAVATVLGRLHRLGYYHGDLSGNLLCVASDDNYSAFLIDLEELHPRLSEKRQVKNLEELGRGVMDLGVVTLRERWEFLRVYGREAGLGMDRCRQLWRLGRSAQRGRFARRG